MLLIEPSFTPRQAAREAKDGIEAIGGRVLGVVLHRRELPFESRVAGKGKRSSKGIPGLLISALADSTALSV